ncbi:hypothetical protein ACP275_06G202100 [Erythranthe tilingii]
MESSKPKRRRSETSSTNLRIPEGIILEILWRLPVKSLLKFKSVSKPWLCLISSKYFKKTYIENSRKHKAFPHHSIISPCWNPGGMMINSCPLHALLAEQSTHAPPLDCPKACLTEMVVLGSCNGLICVGVGRDKISLWNPATRESKELPYFFDGVNDIEYCGFISYGFGILDEISGDYKVYALFYLACWDDEGVPLLCSMGKVYSLKSNSWGETAVYYNETPLHGAIESAGKFASGKLHWIRKITESKWEIVFLDLTSDTFGRLEKPSFMEDDFVPRFGVLDGCLCLFCDSPKMFDIWIWKKYGVEDSWIKFASIAYDSDSWKTPLVTPLPKEWDQLCMLPNGEVLITYMSSEYESKFVIYSPKDNGFRQRYVDKFKDVDQVEVYSESLVPLVLDDEQEKAKP